MKKLIALTLLFVLGLIYVNQLRVTYPFQISEAKTSSENGPSEKKTDQPNKFLQYHRGIRTRDGQSAPEYTSNQKWNELKRVRSEKALRKRAGNGRIQSNGVVEWKERGPANVPGRARALYNVPGDGSENTWLVGSATGGIWRTTNGGASWSDRSSNFEALPISSFSGDASGNVIYAGTGEYVSSIYSATGDGVFKSIDKGLTWEAISSTQNNPDFSIVTRLVTNPDNTDMIVVSTAQSNLVANNTSAIMRSVNRGATWTKVKEISGVFEQIVATPGNFNILYASENGVGVWKSTDAGQTWNLSNTGMQPLGRIEIAVSPVNPNVLFAGAEGTFSGSESDLYRSQDAGTTWSLVDVRFNNQIVDFHQGQGFYDNTILCDPFNVNKVYIGGVSLFRTTLTSGSTIINNYRIDEVNTTGFMFLQSFANVPYDGQRLDIGSATENRPDVEIRFGDGMSQKAHRFLVPDNATSGVPAANYTFTDYVTVPFEVWDITNNQQLMVSFRDQNRNGEFDLVPQALGETDAATDHSREYVYIHITPYSDNANGMIATAGGHLVQQIFNFFPCLAEDAVWDETSLPDSKLVISNEAIEKLNATTVTVADGRGVYDNKNKSDQVNLDQGVHPDHHFIIPININSQNSTYRLLLANDGGVFVSKISTNPGTAEGDWEFRGNSLNTTQFYGIDKAPGQERYIGGSQDNGTRISSSSGDANSTSDYSYAIGGDGFEVLWNNNDPNKLLGSIYYAQLYRSTDGGDNWNSVNGGLPAGDNTEFSFVTKLANSKSFPDRIFTVGNSGVYVSQNFGGNWTLTPISTNFTSGSPFYHDVEVSRANAKIVWAGGGMSAGESPRHLFVSVDGGASFTQTNNYTETTLGSITKLASHPTEPNTAYAIFSFAGGPKILRTTNLGQSWEDISGFGNGNESVNGFPDVAVYCLYVRPDNPNILWAGTEIGIVESVDNGANWSIVDDFPNVAIWDMKGQDNEVVIGTHGRGIWSAILENNQILVPSPKIVTSGTAPLKTLALRIELPVQYDSIQLFIGTSKINGLSALQDVGTYDIQISGVSPGIKDLITIGYIDGAPYTSATVQAELINILAPANSYSTYFTTTTDLVLKNLNTSVLGSRKAVQTSHNYSSNSEHEVFIKRPITIASGASNFFYSDIAIVEPDNDFVVVEATTNGLDWLPIINPYDASFTSGNATPWQSAYASGGNGDRSMFIDHQIDLHEYFDAGEVVLFRMRMVSDEAVNAWGWAIDYITVQEQPVSIAESTQQTIVSLYPNPTRSEFQLQYVLNSTSNVSVSILNTSGGVIQQKDFGRKGSGKHHEIITLKDAVAGTYVVVLETNEGKKVAKLSVIE